MSLFERKLHWPEDHVPPLPPGKAVTGWRLFALSVGLGLFGVLCFVAAVLMNRFAPSAMMFKIAIAPGVAMGGFVAWIVAVNPMSDAAAQVFASRTTFERVRIGVGSFLVFSLMVFMIIAFVLGTLITLATGRIHLAELTVSKVSDGHYRRKGCDHFYRLKAADGHSFLICTNEGEQFQHPVGSTEQRRILSSRAGRLIL